MKKLSVLLAVVVSSVLAAPVAEAQHDRTPPEGRFEMTMQGHQDGVAGMFIKGDEAMCRSDMRWGDPYSGPCQRVAQAHGSGYVAELQNRAARQAYYVDNMPSMIPGSYGFGGGIGNRRSHNGSWYQSIGDGFYCKEQPGENCFGKYDEAALWGTILRESGDIFTGYLGHRRANKSMDQNYELSQREMDLEERQLEFRMEQQRRRQQAPAPVAQQAPAHAHAPVQTTPGPTPASTPSVGTVLTNRTPDDIFITEQGRQPILLLAGESMPITNLSRVKFATNGCDLRAPVKNNRGGVSITCAAP